MLRPLKTTLRVLMAVPQYPFPVIGGLERQAYLLSTALNPLGVDVVVLSGKINPSSDQKK